MADIYEKKPYESSAAFEAGSASYAVAFLVLSLVQVLKNKGVIQFSDYRSEVLGQYEELSGDEVGGGAGAVFETVLQMLNGLKD